MYDEFEPLTNDRYIRSAFESLRTMMERGAQRVDTILGWKGKNHEFTIHWHPDLGIWNYFDPEFAETRYWCPYGIVAPTNCSMVPITVEINFTYTGYNRRIAGTFLRDADGNIYLGHTGGVGGSRRGIGKRAFRNFYPADQTVRIRWPDNKLDTIICIGRLDSDQLPMRIAHFVKEVANFKNSV